MSAHDSAGTSGGSAGIHHVTAIAGDPQRNLDFYAGTLGLRLVKRTVNFDDPGTYHFYFGDERGRPGTLLTFFPWPGVPRGRRGVGEVDTVTFSVPPDALDYWQRRLQSLGVAVKGPLERFGEPAIAFEDPDGMALEIVAHPEAGQEPGWNGGPAPAEHAIRAFRSVRLAVAAAEPTAEVLTRVLGFRERAVEGPHHRYQAGSGLASIAEIVAAPGKQPGMGAGSVHHVAWRARDDADQLRLRREVIGLGLTPTEVVERVYFRSVYFREPGGVLFEIATDTPGFLTDESLESLGAELKLPPWLERTRDRIEQAVPPIRMPAVERPA